MLGEGRWGGGLCVWCKSVEGVVGLLANVGWVYIFFWITTAKMVCADGQVGRMDEWWATDRVKAESAERLSYIGIGLVGRSVV